MAQNTITCSIFGQCLSHLNSSLGHLSFESIKSYPLQYEITSTNNCATFSSHILKIKLISDNKPDVQSYKLSHSLGEYPDYRQSKTFVSKFSF